SLRYSVTTVPVLIISRSTRICSDAGRAVPYARFISIQRFHPSAAATGVAIKRFLLPGVDGDFLFAGMNDEVEPLCGQRDKPLLESGFIGLDLGRLRRQAIDALLKVVKLFPAPVIASFEPLDFGIQARVFGCNLPKPRGMVSFKMSGQKPA